MTLYRIYGRRRWCGRRVLLYIGRTINPVDARLFQHSRSQPWWGDARRVRTKEYSDEAGLIAAEREAIRAENPLHNVVRFTRPDDAGPFWGWPEVPELTTEETTYWHAQLCNRGRRTGDRTT